MANNLPTLLPFDAGSNPSVSWRNWRQDFEDYIEALRYGNESEKTKTALFRHVCGDDLKKQYRSFEIKPEPGTTEITLQQILDEFNKHFGEFQNEVFASFKFLEIKQEQGEKISEFYLRLRSAVTDCNYGDITDRMLRDKVIHGLQDKPLQERLIRETGNKAKTLQEVLTECKTAEYSRAQASEMNINSRAAIESVDRVSRAFVSRNSRDRIDEFRSDQKVKYDVRACKFCGRFHERRNCPAYGSKCNICQMKNHWATVCNSRSKNRKKVHHLNTIECNTNEESDSENAYLGELKTVDMISTHDIDSVWYQNIYVNGNSVKFKLDTGAQVNIIPQSELLKWKNAPTVKITKQPVLDYSDNPVPIIGECNLKCKTEKLQMEVRFLVTSLRSNPILGLQACKNLGLIKRIYQIVQQRNSMKIRESPESIIEEFADVFSGTGRLDRIVKIKLKKDFVPHIAAPRKIPLALHERVKQELQHMVESNIITKVEEPTEWVSNMVVVDTPKKLRICLDPRPLNEAIQRSHYPVPSADRLLSHFQDCKIFSVLDAKNGFWQLPLDKASSFLTTFTTPWGRYRFLVLPFGLNNAPEEFQRAMDDIFEGEPKITPYFDDIALGSSSVTEHCQLLRRILSLARKSNLKFNRQKTQLALSSVQYLGHIISDKGIKPDPKKTEAIQEYVAPRNREELQRFLGMVTYLAKFTPHFSNLSHSLRLLLKQDTEWLWDENVQRDFELIKKTIINAPCLQYFNVNKPVTVSVDASKNGIGAVLMQDSQPVAFGSVSLTDTQQRYAQIEKELLAVIYGLEHFHYYTYGRPVIIQTDHKPLLGLNKKPYDSVSPRLQRMLLRLNKYNINLTYIPGKQLIMADALSRAQLPEIMPIEVEESDMSTKVCLLATASNPKWEEYSQKTSSDEELQDVLYHIINGWPDKVHTRQAAQAYWQCRDELYYTNDGILCRGHRLVVPMTLRKEVLQIIHFSHRGIVACKSKARQYFYWPSMNKDIEDYVGKCLICQAHQRSNQRETLLDTELPQQPWQKVACDFFHLKGREYLLIIDYFSKYVEVQLMNSTSALSVISAMKAIFARHGIPEELVSDGGPPFKSEAMKKFLKEWNVNHTITSPHFPRANGQVERAVQTLKNALTKAEQEGKDLCAVLLDYRIQPSNDLPSPSELLMGRRLRSFLPSHPDLLKPNFPTKETCMALKKRQEKQRIYADRHAKQLPSLEKNTKVWFYWKANEPWKQGTIIQVGPQPRSYVLQGRDGARYRRNRFHIRLDRSNCEGNKIAPTRTVEDLYPSFEMVEHSKSIPLARNSQSSQSSAVNIPTRKSSRKADKPARYRDI